VSHDGLEAFSWEGRGGGAAPGRDSAARPSGRRPDRLLGRAPASGVLPEMPAAGLVFRARLSGLARAPKVRAFPPGSLRCAA